MQKQIKVERVCQYCGRVNVQTLKGRWWEPHQCERCDRLLVQNVRER